MQQLNQSHSALYIALVGVNAIYACTSIFTKMASLQEMVSWRFIFWIICAIGIMGIYAVIWQKIIAKIPLSTAYMFKGTSLIFVLLISAVLFGESITYTNIIGSIIIIAGIVLFAKA